MKIATFNANSIRVREGIIKSWLKKHKPNVLCIQETKCQDKDFPFAVYEDAGYNVYYAGEKSYNGVAIITDLKPTKVSFGFDAKESEKTRLVRADFKGFSVINTYIPQGQHPDSDKFKYKLGWFRKLYKYIDANFTTRKKLVWTGDFNVAVDDRDVHAPKRLYGECGFHPKEHKELAKFSKWGFVDVFRKYDESDDMYTYWDYRGDTLANNRGWRIDHIWATPAMANKSVNCIIDKKPRYKERPSDHTFLSADFEL